MVDASISERRKYGVHLTPSDVFDKFIFPEIEGVINKYLWIDLYAGEGNLIFPILDRVVWNDRIEFFRDHIFISDIQENMVNHCIGRALEYELPEDIVRRNIVRRDNLKSFPLYVLDSKFPIYHITNPPYLYLGYIRKHKDMRSHLNYFGGNNRGYQDLYQIAMVNDLRHNIHKMAYIIPSNFLFGNSVSNKIREDLFNLYNVVKAFIIEDKIFEFTGMNVCICFFKRRQIRKMGKVEFTGTKIQKDGTSSTKIYQLLHKFKYRAGTKFFEFVDKYITKRTLEVSFYLKMEEVKRHKGKEIISVIDANDYDGKSYNQIDIEVSETLKNKIENNGLYVRTIDTGAVDGRIGLEGIEADFGVKGICVTSNTARTQPIQLFFSPTLSEDDQWLLYNYFNILLEYLRKITDSDFLTTYKYSTGNYARKYLGLTQVKAIIETFPILSLTSRDKDALKSMLLEQNITGIIEILKKYMKKKINPITKWLS